MNPEYNGPETPHADSLLRKIGKRIHDMISPDAETRRERNRLMIAKAIKRGNYIHIHSAEGAPGFSSEHLARLRPARFDDSVEQKNN